MRSFRVFETLARARQPLSSAEIAQAIDAPRSSTADLLRTLVGLNLLSIDRRSATYFPTARFSALGNWLEQSWLGAGGLREVLREFADKCGETLVLSTPTDLEIEIVAVFEAQAGIAWSPEVGQRYPVFGSAIGTSYLATLPVSTIRAMHRRIETTLRPAPELSKTLQDVRASQRGGFAWNMGGFNPEVAAVACHLKRDSMKRPMFIAVGGPLKRMQEKRVQLEQYLSEFLASRVDA